MFNFNRYYSSPFTCKDCKKRWIGCHGSCEEYQKIRREMDQENKRRYQEKESRRMTTKWILKNIKRKEMESRRR